MTFDEKFQTEHPDKILPLVDVKAGKLPLVKGDSGVQLTASCSANVASTSVSVIFFFFNVVPLFFLDLKKPQH